MDSKVLPGECLESMMEERKQGVEDFYEGVIYTLDYGGNLFSSGVGVIECIAC